MAVEPIPDGYHAVTPYLIVDGAAALVDFMKQAFGAKERMRMEGPTGAIAHAEVEIGDSVVMLGDASPENRPTSTMIHLYVEDADAVYERAIEAGASSVRELRDEFYGDRNGGVKDAFGNIWWIATHVEDVSPEEIERRQEALAQQ